MCSSDPTMLPKSFALFAAFAAFASVFASPIPGSVADVTAVVEDVANDLTVNVGTRAEAVENDSPSFDEVVKLFELSRRDDGCSVIDIDGIIYNVLNNGTITVLKRDDCNVARATAQVRDVVNKARANALSARSKRGEEKRYSYEEIEAIVVSEANNLKKTNAATRSKADKRDAGVYAIVERVLDNFHADDLTLSKRGTYTVSQIATAVKNALDGVTGSSKRSDNVDALAEQVLDELYAQAAKRTDDINA